MQYAYGPTHTIATSLLLGLTENLSPRRNADAQFSWAQNYNISSVSTAHLLMTSLLLVLITA